MTNGDITGKEHYAIFLSAALFFCHSQIMCRLWAEKNPSVVTMALNLVVQLLKSSRASHASLQMGFCCVYRKCLPHSQPTSSVSKHQFGQDHWPESVCKCSFADAAVEQLKKMCARLQTFARCLSGTLRNNGEVKQLMVLKCQLVFIFLLIFLNCMNCPYLLCFFNAALYY